MANKGNQNEYAVCNAWKKWTTIKHFRNPQSGANHQANKLTGGEDILSVLPTHFNIETKDINSYKRQLGTIKKKTAVGTVLNKVYGKTNGKIPVYMVRRIDVYNGSRRKKLWDIYLPAFLEPLLASFGCRRFFKNHFITSSGHKVDFIGVESPAFFSIDYVELFYAIEFLIERKQGEFANLDKCNAARFIPDKKEKASEKLHTAQNLFGYKCVKPSFFNSVNNNDLEVSTMGYAIKKPTIAQVTPINLEFLLEKLPSIDYIIVDGTRWLVLTSRTLNHLFGLKGVECRKFPCKINSRESYNRSNFYVN